MPTYYHTVTIKNNKKLEHWHETKEEALDHLRQLVAEEVFGSVLTGNKGVGFQKKVQMLVEAIPQYEEKCITLEDHIKEYIQNK